MLLLQNDTSELQYVSQTIFLLEDDTDIAKLVRYNLENAGYTVQAFTNAGEVLPAAERTVPALFLLDIMVPGGDGLDLCRRIASERRPQHGSSHLPDRAGKRKRSCAWPGAGCGRLHYQALQHARVAGARQGRAPPF